MMTRGILKTTGVLDVEVIKILLSKLWGKFFRIINSKRLSFKFLRKSLRIEWRC